MMKKFILFIASVMFAGMLSAQINGVATLRMELVNPPTNPGDEFTVELWLDVLDHSPDPNNTIKSAQIMFEFDEAVCVPISSGPPFNRYWYDLNQMFTDYSAQPANAYPFPGDLRFVFYTTIAPGMDPQWYGGIPIKLWDMHFTYNGGNLDIQFGTTQALSPVAPNLAGGIKSKAETIVTSWDDGVYDLTLLGIGGGTTTYTWTGGATSGDWFLGGNWDQGSAPGASDDVVIPAGTPHDPVIGTFVADCQNMQLNDTLEIDDDGALTVAATLTNDGFIKLIGNNIGGSLIYGSLDAAGTGTFEYDRYLSPGANGAHAGWHMISAPFNNTVTGDFVGYWVKSWLEATNTYFDIDPWGANGGDCCTDPSSFDVPISTMQGFSVKQDLSYACWAPTGDVIEFGGDHMNNSGAPPCPFNLATAPAGVSNVNDDVLSFAFKGGNSNWDLLGNPYLSAIDWDLVTIPAGMANGIYYWSDANDNYASYVGGVGNPIGTTSEIPPTQGFFVATTANGTINFDNTIRVHGTQQYYKDEVNDIVRLSVTSGDMSDQTVIRFLEGTNQNWDKAYDAKKLFNTENVSLYTTENALELSINTQPAADLVHMGFKAPVTGTYTIEAIETSDFGNVVLEDVQTGIETDLLTDSYTFNYTTGDNPNRFIVHFTPLGTPELEANSIRIWASERNIYVSVPETVTGDVAVYNMMGQEVVANKVIPGMNVIPVNDVNTYYVVKVMSGNNVKTEKVFIR